MILLPLVLSLVLCTDRPLPADRILLNGNILSMNPKAPKAEALAIRDHRIVAVGSAGEVQKFAGPATQTLDLKGATAIPGFIDGHAHLAGIGKSQMILNLMGVKSWDEIIAMVKEATAKVPPGTWISGRGWHQEKWAKTPESAVEGYPVHQQLSAVSPNHPVMLIHASGHALFANAKAMSLAGIDSGTPAPEGGKILHDAQGNPIGVFEENAMDSIKSAQLQKESQFTTAERKTLIRRQVELAVKECLSKGITTLHDAGVPFETLDVYRDMADKGELDMRLWVMAGANNAELSEKLPNYVLKGYGDGHLTLGGIKCYMDGALGSRGAWLLKPYEDLPTSTGQNVTSLADLAQTAEIAKKFNLQLCIHAIGDRGNREVLNLYEKALNGADLRWRIEHAQHLDPADIPRFAQLNVIASMQGIHCTSDSPFVEKRLGKGRADAGAYVWRKLVESGATITNGTDAPVEDVSPIASFYSMVTRLDGNGQPFYPAQTLSAMEALRVYTWNNAYAGFQESDRGSLEVGKYADITVLSEDLSSAPPNRIKETKVLYTIVGGETKYQAKSL